MKKIFQIFVMLLVAATVRGQVTFSPASFTAEDPFTITIDVTNTGMAGQTEAYIWIFAFNTPDPNGPATNASINGAWTMSTEEAKLTNVGPNKFKFDVESGSILFGLTPGQLNNGFGFLLKKRDGSAQTSDFKPYKFDPLTFTPSLNRVFPAKVGRSDVVSINYDRTLAATTNEQRMTPTHALVTAYDETGAQVGTEIEIPVRVLRSEIWIATFIPSARFTPSTSHTLTKFRYRFKGTMLNTEGAATTVTGSESEVVFTELK